MARRRFLVNFLKHPGVTGSITPSSRFLVRKMVESLGDLDSCRCVVEFGAGEGCLTRYLEKRLPEGCKILSFEINKDLLDRVNCRNGNVILVNDDVARLERYLKKYNIRNVDHVVSSLPLAQIRREDCLNLLSMVYRNLKDNGVYVQYQYSLLSKGLIESVFENVEVRFTPLNIPPAFIYVCRK
ncbi:MAG TPA: methyltransferase domain-containing protein [Candidatus Nanoarchaeia archaeon]|nr:methyltransferase domain-containing protein [Candidatus Nanoarchaeia archaeon]